jgi:hypothetical protein
MSRHSFLAATLLSGLLTAGTSFAGVPYASFTVTPRPVPSSASSHPRVFAGTTTPQVALYANSVPGVQMLALNNLNPVSFTTPFTRPYRVHPDVQDGYVSYMDRNARGGDAIMVWDGAQNRMYRVNTSTVDVPSRTCGTEGIPCLGLDWSGVDSFPALGVQSDDNGHRVVWQSQANGSFDIAYAPLPFSPAPAEGTAPVRIPDPGIDTRPQIWKDFVVYERTSATMDVYLYDLRQSFPKRLMVAASARTEKRPHIHDGRIVFMWDFEAAGIFYVFYRDLTADGLGFTSPVRQVTTPDAFCMPGYYQDARVGGTGGKYVIYWAESCTTSHPVDGVRNRTGVLLVTVFRNGQQFFYWVDEGVERPVDTEPTPYDIWDDTVVYTKLVSGVKRVMIARLQP